MAGGAVLRLGAGLTLVGCIPLQNHCIDGEHGGMVAGADLNPANQRWGFWPLLPISSHLTR